MTSVKNFDSIHGLSSMTDILRLISFNLFVFLKTKCSFCDKTFSSSTELSEHLVLCGNKTDQCPTCRRFIRRAIFAYHFENNCANLDENTSNARQTSKIFI